MKVFVGLGTALALLIAGILTSGCQGPKAKGLATSGSSATETEHAATDGMQRPSTPITEEELATLHANFNRVLFQYDSAELDEDSRKVLAANAEILLAHFDVSIQVEGHADHWGSDVYNLALGQRRAEAVRTYLTTYGVPMAQLRAISYGEERPLIGEGDRNTEAPNRRAEFLVIVGNNVANSSY